MVCISNVNNKYEAGVEASYGVEAVAFDLDLGQVQTITIGEEENTEKLASINGGHTYNIFEDGLYWAPVSIETLVTKASLPILLKATLGSVVETTEYAATTTTDFTSYSLNASYSVDQIAKLKGFVVKDFDISGAKGESVAITLNGTARVAVIAAGTVTVTKNTDKIFKDLDMSVLIGGNASVLNSFNIAGNWNVTDDEGRGIEAVVAGERRLLTCFTKHVLDLNGSYEAEVSNDLEFGYIEERTNEEIVFTISRGTDNEHVFTMSDTRSFNRELNLSTDNTKRVVSYDYEALDVSVVGDL